MKKTIIKITLFLLSFASIISCTGVQVDPNDPNAHLIQGVKQAYQGPLQCGATSLEMILQYYDLDISKHKIDKSIRPRGKGVGCSTLENYPMSHNFKTESLMTSDPEKLKEFISKDIPLIARVHSEGAASRCHYVVLVGYTDKGFIINDPISGTRFKSYDEFKKWHSCSFFNCGPYWFLAIYR